jgi:hypothetical protein
MAVKKKSSRATAAAKPSEQVSAKVGLTVSEGTATFCVNLVEVTHTPHDFSVTCGRVPSKISVQDAIAVRDSGELKIEAPVQLIIPSTVFPALMEVFSKQLAMYESQFGPLKTPEGDAGAQPSEH